MATEGLIEAAGDGQRTFEPHAEAAFLGLLRGHAEVTHALEARLSRDHGLGLSGYELLTGLAQTEGGMRVGACAARAGLSISRASRLIDQLATRGLVSRRACATDSRVVYVEIEPAGRALAREAQETFFEVIDRAFLGRLTCAEVEILGGLLARLYEPAEPDGA